MNKVRTEKGRARGVTKEPMQCNYFIFRYLFAFMFLMFFMHAQTFYINK